jgi:hypothetical protein
MDIKAERSTVTRILRDSALELLLTFCLMFGVTTIVRWVIGPSPISRIIPQIQAELLIVGAAVGILIAGLILSPPGRITGGHMNPAISLAMWRFGVFPGPGGSTVYRCPISGFCSGCGDSSRDLGSGRGRGAGSLRRASAGAWLVISNTFRGGDVKYGGDRSAGRRLSRRTPVGAIRTLDCGRGHWFGHRGIGYFDRGERESGSPVWASCPFRADPFPVGVFAGANGWGPARRLAPAGHTTPPGRIDPQTVRHSPRRQRVVGIRARYTLGSRV